MSKELLSTPTRIELTRPDDWHLHLRDGAALAAVLPDTARRFARAIVMPNLRPPVTTVAQAQAYRDRILAALPEGLKFEPLMTLYLTDSTTCEEIERAADSPYVHAVKLYPAGATTNSDAGVSDMAKVYPVLAKMERVGLPLLMHGEVTDVNVDVFDRERVFIDRIFIPLTAQFPALRAVFEHITTRDAAQFVAQGGPNIAATLTAHHLLMNRNAIFAGGVRPHHYCLPILKRETHRQALLDAVASGNPKFFLGTDSAPHSRSSKETECGCAGCYTAHAAIELYAEAFEQIGALDKLEAFASFHGPDWYGLPRNTERIVLEREVSEIPSSLPYLENDMLVPLRAGSSVSWRMASIG